MAKKPKEDPLFGGLDILDGGVERALCIGKVPGRKKYALYAMEGSTFDALAYFRDREAAEHALRLIRLIAVGRFDAESSEG